MSWKSKDQINVNNNDRKNGVKTEDCIKTENVEMIGNMHNRYIDDKYKDLINNNFTNELKNGDFWFTILIIELT